MSFLTRESLLVDCANRNNRDLLLMVLTGSYGTYTAQEVDQALIRAAINGHGGCVSLLLDWGADSDAPDMDGDTPLMLAACNSHLEVVRLLLKAGCGVNRTSDRQRTALHMAAWVGSVQICRLLLKAGADLRVQEMYGDTPLMLAAHRSPDVAQFLIRQNVEEDEDFRGRRRVGRGGRGEGGGGGTGRRRSRGGDGGGSEDNADDSVSGTGEGGEEDERHVGGRGSGRGGGMINMTNDSGDSALGCAVKAGHLRCVQDLLGAGAWVDHQNRHGETPLMFAAYEDRPKIARCLLEHGANPDLPTKSGAVPLHIACQKRMEELCQVLLDHDANPDLADKMGQRALTLAVTGGRLEMVARLLQAGASPRYQCPTLFQRRMVVVTPLYKALLDRRLDLARLLHRAGGCSQEQLRQVLHCPDLRSELEDTVKGREVLDFLRDIASSPAPLRLSCLQAVQCGVGGRGRRRRERILSLSSRLPRPLIAFLLFEDLDQSDGGLGVGSDRGVKLQESEGEKREATRNDE